MTPARGLSPNDMNRFYAIKELIETERNFFKDIKLCYDAFMTNSSVSFHKNRSNFMNFINSHLFFYEKLNSLARMVLTKWLFLED